MIPLIQQQIRPAKPADAAVLTEISHAAKRHWRYPEEYLARWAEELTITTAYLLENPVFVFSDAHCITGFYAVVHRRTRPLPCDLVPETAHWLDHMFVLPRHIGCGTGTRLVQHLLDWGRTKTIPGLWVLSDPHARGFYEKMGFDYLGEVPSSIPDRTTPLLRYALSLR